MVAFEKCSTADLFKSKIELLSREITRRGCSLVLPKLLDKSLGSNVLYIKFANAYHICGILGHIDKVQY